MAKVVLLIIVYRHDFEFWFKNKEVLEQIDFQKNFTELVF